MVGVPDEAHNGWKKDFVSIWEACRAFTRAVQIVLLTVLFGLLTV